MKLKSILQSLDQIAIKYNISKPYICGGVPRDKVMGKLENIADLDITCGDGTVFSLAEEFSIFLKRDYKIQSKTSADGHASIFFENLKIDFSSNFNTLNITKILNSIGVQNPTGMDKEIYSRDFTCNALLLSTDLKNIIDITGKGVQDIENKIIKTCLSPEITLNSNKNRVIRAIYLSAKLDFDIDQSIIDYVSSNPSVIKNSNPKTLSEKLNKGLEINADRVVYLLDKMSLWKEIPITDQLAPYYNKKIQSKIIA